MISTLQLQTTILGCWLLFFIYWLANAFTTKKMKEGATGPATYWNRVLLIAGAILIGSFFEIDQRLGLTQLVVPHNTATTITSAVIVIVGLAVAIWARKTLASNWSSNVTLKEDHQLITVGPYKYVRHPIYTGILTMLFGTALSIGTSGALVGFGLCVASLWMKISLEENLMTRHFKDKYVKYRASTKAIIPGLL